MYDSIGDRHKIIGHERIWWLSFSWGPFLYKHKRSQNQVIKLPNHTVHSGDTRCFSCLKRPKISLHTHRLYNSSLQSNSLWILNANIYCTYYNLHASPSPISYSVVVSTKTTNPTTERKDFFRQLLQTFDDSHHLHHIQVRPILQDELWWRQTQMDNSPLSAVRQVLI